MKITIEGSPKELAELISTLPNGAETEAKKPYFPPLLTDMEDNNCTIKRNRETISAFKKGHELANQCEENAPQEEAAEQKIKDFANTLQGCLKQASQNS